MRTALSTYFNVPGSKYIGGARSARVHLFDYLPRYDRARADCVREIRERFDKGQVVVIAGMAGVGKSSLELGPKVFKISNILGYGLVYGEHYTIDYFARALRLDLPRDLDEAGRRVKEYVGERIVVFDDLIVTSAFLGDAFTTLISFLRKAEIGFVFNCPMGQEYQYLASLAQAGIDNVRVVKVPPFNRKDCVDVARKIANDYRMEIPEQVEFYDRLYYLTGGNARLMEALISNISTVGWGLNKFEYFLRFPAYYQAIGYIRTNLERSGLLGILRLGRNGEYPLGAVARYDAQAVDVLRRFLEYGVLRISNDGIVVNGELIRRALFE